VTARPRESLILDTVLDMVFRTALLFSLFLLFVGHNAPGGGFVGGLVAATALTLRYVAGGADEVDRIARVHEATLLGSGLLLAALTGAAGWWIKGSFLASAKLEVAVPVLGTLKATPALPFDVGVYLVVVGLGLSLLRSLGAAADREQSEQTEPRREVTE
jgi:multicomponent Na+:H+ antiporter subunit A